MKRKAVFFDIDGTLYEAGKPIVPSTAKAIEKIRENGHLAFICTGRSRIMVPDVPVLELGFDGVVASCGTYGEYEGRELFHYPLSEAQLTRMVDNFRRYKAVYILEGTEYIYYDEEMVTEKDLEEDWYLKHAKNAIPHNFLPLKDVKEVGACKASIHARNINPEELYGLFRDEYEVLEHVFGVAEFVPKGFSKAKGIELMCRELHIDPADTIAVGDSVNDLDMLKAANIGICMGNGSDVAKECADYVTADMYEDGIYRAMEHFGLI
ncbi:MAG: Cof-type HAD-IIB family hydrolase [Lachnospiraceae bacterium]|nr:Cof-type HAD-IIB family hydrolase [Lachnospiraceae bacterium]